MSSGGNNMLSETIQLRLKERFAAPLPEFHKRRIVFWREEDGEFSDALGELDLKGVATVKLTGRNNFATKKLLAADDLTGDYLIYDPPNCFTPTGSSPRTKWRKSSHSLLKCAGA
jgi:hypothetical protein